MEYLYEVSKNGINFSKVKVIKECPRTYFIDKIIDKRVYKIEGNDELAGYNTYCWYFKDETIAKNWLNSIKNRNFACKCETKTLSNGNQKAIECLENVRAILNNRITVYYTKNGIKRFKIDVDTLNTIISKKISELKGE